MAIAAVAIVAVIGSVTVFGALRFDEPAPPAEDEFSSFDTDEEGSTTTTTFPPTLEDLLPGCSAIRKTRSMRSPSRSSEMTTSSACLSATNAS